VTTQLSHEEIRRYSIGHIGVADFDVVDESNLQRQIIHGVSTLGLSKIESVKRRLINDACALLGKPDVYGSVFRFEGPASVFYAKEGPCYRCLFSASLLPGRVPSCAESGVPGLLPGLIGVIQATGVVKLIIGQGEPLIGRLLVYDALAMNFTTLKLRKNPAWVVCSDPPSVTRLIDYDRFCGVVPRDVEARQSIEITVQELQA
jgi:sulfur-carrier protein adenylyltransferase/sulfurtransferase